MSSLGLTRDGCRRQQHRAAGERHPGEEQVHIQRPPPGQVLGQRAAGQQARRAAGRGDRPVDAERLAAVLRPGERGGQQRQRRRHQQRRERALAGPRGYQHGEADRGAADGRHPGEPGQAGQERRLPPQQVSQPATGQQQAAERQRVRGDHPLPAGGSEIQRPLRRRQRDVHHRQVQDHHQLRQADHAQDQPPPVPGTAGRGGIRHEKHHFFSVVTAPRAEAFVTVVSKALKGPIGLSGWRRRMWPAAYRAGMLAWSQAGVRQGEQASLDSGD
jgi:hypothetical protein